MREIKKSKMRMLAGQGHKYRFEHAQEPIQEVTPEDNRRSKVGLSPLIEVDLSGTEPKEGSPR